MSLIWAALRPVLGLILQAGLSALFDYLRERKATADAREQGRTEVRAEAAEAKAAAVQRMEAVPLPGDADVVEILKRGDA